MRTRHALALAVFTAPVLGAQEVRGTLYDSLRTQAPIANALITVGGRPERVRTDARGRFVFDSLPPGEWFIRYQAPWLDSLSLPPLVALVSVSPGRSVRSVTLATPSLPRYQRALCGASFLDDRAVMHGEIRDAEGLPRAGVFVGAVWSEALLTREGLTSNLVGTVDTSNTQGMFSLCGVPRGATFLVRAGSDTLGTGDLYLHVDEGRGVIRRDLIVGPRGGTARASGQVRTERGVPIRGVVTSIAGDSVGARRGDAEGRFTLEGLSPRSQQMFVRAIGFTPRYVDLAPVDGEVDFDVITLAPLPQELAEIRVTASARTAREMEFRERQRRGMGIFLDRESIQQTPVISATTLASRSTRVRTSGGSQPRTFLRSNMWGSGWCAPRFFLDGVDWGRPVDGFEEGDLLRRAAFIEIHPAPFMPAQFTDFDGCGVILIWTD